MNVRGLYLEHQYYSPADLLRVCYDKLHTAALPEWESHLYGFIQRWLSPEPVLEVKTSGATGIPKILHVSKAAMRHSARMTGAYFRLQSGDTALLCLPVSHIAGQMMLVRAWELGLNLFCRAPQQLCLSDLPAINFAPLVPQQLYRLQFEVEDGLQQLARINILLLGGGVLPPVLQAALPQLSCQVYQSYGMTETLSHIAIRRLHPEPQAYYQVLPGVQVETDQRDCLRIHAPDLGVTHLPTNDVVVLHGTEGFELLGRFDNLINVGGFKWQPEQLEAQLATHGGDILRGGAFFIGALPDAKLGQKLVLVIEGTEDMDKAWLSARLSQIFTPYQCPKAVYFISRLPRTATAKIQRQVVLEQLMQEMP